MLDKVTKFRQWWEKLSLQDLKSLRILLIIIIVADLFGVWWALGLKKIAVLLFIFLIAFLVVVIIYERRLSEMEQEKSDNKKEKNIEEQIQDGIDDAMKAVDDATNVDLGL